MGLACVPHVTIAPTLTLDARYGTGTIRSASLVLISGTFPMDHVLRCRLNAKLMMMYQVPVSPATTGIILLKVHAILPLQWSILARLMLDARLGQMENASNAMIILPSTQVESVLRYPTNVRRTQA